LGISDGGQTTFLPPRKNIIQRETEKLATLFSRLSRFLFGQALLAQRSLRFSVILFIKSWLTPLTGIFLGPLAALFPLAGKLIFLNFVQFSGFAKCH